jgi:hypothetical protein
VVRDHDRGRRRREYDEIKARCAFGHPPRIARGRGRALHSARTRRSLWTTRWWLVVSVSSYSRSLRARACGERPHLGAPLVGSVRDS